MNTEIQVGAKIALLKCFDLTPLRATEDQLLILKTGLTVTKIERQKTQNKITLDDNSVIITKKEQDNEKGFAVLRINGSSSSLCGFLVNEQAEIVKHAALFTKMWKLSKKITEATEKHVNHRARLMVENRQNTLENITQSVEIMTTILQHLEQLQEVERI